MSSAAVRATVVSAAALLFISIGGCGSAERPRSTATVQVRLDRVISTFSGSALGASLDGHGQGDVAAIYTPANLRAMRGVGLASITYRLRTELGSEAWHWNPAGRFSGGNEGYWTSSSSGPLPPVVYGYRLPRRGNTIDQANNDGYSRIDDGDPRTFWKSNPYLDSHFTHEPESGHPQWVMLDLGRTRPVDALRLDWADPYATRFEIQAWSGATPPARYGAENENAIFANGIQGRWSTLGKFNGRGGSQLIRLATAARGVRWLRVYMTASSHTHARGARDIRDGLGFALREIHAGALVGHRLHDFVRHGASNASQSVIWVSSTDPWHRASDRDPNLEQPSFDRVYSSGLTRGRGVLVPIALAYGTPEDAVAELRYLRARGFAVSGVELGEEPDGQLLGPDDYASLYAQFARSIRRGGVYAPLGGPSFSTAIPDWTVWPDGHATTSWTGRMVARLRALDALSSLRFFSFEWYPVDDVCGPVGPALAAAPQALTRLVALQRGAGLPSRLPIVITEFGYSAFAASAELGRAGAVADADTIGGLLSLGGRVGYLYGLEPDVPIRESVHCATFGNLTLFASDDAHRIRFRTAAFWFARMLERRWFATAGAQSVLATRVSGPLDGAGLPVVGAYALRRDSGVLSMLIVNRDPVRALTARLRIAGGGRLGGVARVDQLSARDYEFHPRGESGYAGPDALPSRSRIASIELDSRGISIPPESVSVVTATVSG